MIRNDTAIPILICWFFLFVFSTHCVIKEQFKLKGVYTSLLCALLLFFHLSDGHISAHNKSEKKAILEIAKSEKHCVVINDYCTIMSYRPITDSLESSMNTELLQYWGVLDKQRLYYQKY